MLASSLNQRLPFGESVRIRSFTPHQPGYHGFPKHLQRDRYSKFPFPASRTLLTTRPPQKVLITCVTVAVVFVAMRSGARFFKARKAPLAPEDLFIYLALICFIIMCSLYLAAMPTLYNAEAVAAGLMLPYASLETDLVAMLKEFLAVQMFFWATLWAVKLSLLCMFKRLTIGLPLYTKIVRILRIFWWKTALTITAFQYPILV